MADGVYSAGNARLTAAGAAGLPQVIVPGAIDHVNFWAGQVLPERYRDREFFRYNAQNLLMRTNAEEFQKLGVLIAERLNAAKGPVRVLIPFEGFSEHTKLRAQRSRRQRPWSVAAPGGIPGVHGNPQGQPQAGIPLEEFPLHINDAQVCRSLRGRVCRNRQNTNFKK